MSLTFEKAQEKIWSIIETGVKKGDSFAKIRDKVLEQAKKENGGKTWKDDVGPFRSWVNEVLKSPQIKPFRHNFDVSIFDCHK